MRCKDEVCVAGERARGVIERECALLCVCVFALVMTELQVWAGWVHDVVRKGCILEL